jgi:hypothetical protein
MAYIAIINTLPKKRNQWNPYRRDNAQTNPDTAVQNQGMGMVPRPSIRPPKTQGICSDGFERVRIPIPFGGYAWDKGRILPGENPRDRDMKRQVTGIRQTLPPVGADLHDRVNKGKTTGYKKITKINNNINEDFS